MTRSSLLLTSALNTELTRISKCEPETYTTTVLETAITSESIDKDKRILALLHLSKVNPHKFHAHASTVLTTPDDWNLFITLARSKVVRNGIGRAIKTEMKRALTRYDQACLEKNKKQITNMIRICRPTRKVNPEIIRLAMDKDE